MRIALMIAEGVMAAMGGRPGHDRSLRRHRSQYGKNRLDGSGRLKCTMGEMAMVAQSNPDMAEPVHAQQQQNFHPADSRTQEQYDARDEGKKWDDNYPKCDALFEYSGVVGRCADAAEYSGVWSSTQRFHRTFQC